MSHLLIYDADLSGHHRDYLDAIVNYVEKYSPLDRGISQVSYMLPAGYWSARVGMPSPIQANRIDIPSEFLDQRNSLPPRKRALLEVEMLANIVYTHSIDELVLMNLDYFQVALSTLAARNIACKVSGIQFQPYTRLEKVARQAPLKPSLFFRALRKRYRLQRILNNINVFRLLVPADFAAVDLLNQRHQKHLRAVMLPEPYLGTLANAIASNSTASPDIRKRYGLKPASRVVLIFGTIAPRKNVEKVIGAMDILYQSSQQNTELLVVGKASLDYQKKLRVLASTNNAAESGIHFDFEFVENDVMRALFQSCDVVAMPYSKAYQSSGILFQALEYQKPVITANQGLVHDLVQQYALGESVDPTDPKEICKAISKLLDMWSPSVQAQVLVECHTAENHAAVLLNQR
ncbi:MAG: glycosyltransferase [Granulosicoccus sp.]